MEPHGPCEQARWGTPPDGPRSIRRAPGWRHSVAAVGPIKTSYRYLMRLVPHAQPPSVGSAAPVSDPVVGEPAGWELISSRVTGEGDELSVFRRPVTQPATSDND